MDEGLYVEGHLDVQDSEVAREAWRSMKNNTVGLSFGYMVTDERERSDGIRELRGVDLFEVTLTPSPANPHTRVLSMKSLPDIDVSAVAKEHYEAVVKSLAASERKSKPIQVASFEC